MSEAPGSTSAEDHTTHDLHRHFDPEILDRFYAEVLVPSFRPEELQSLESMAAGLTRSGEPGVLASVAIGSGGEILGGIVAERYPDSEVLLVGYLAVRPDRRGRGIATSLARRAESEWYSDESVRLALGEVKDPRSWTGVGDDEPVARLRFFERLGARVLTVPFIQPALGPEGRRVRGFLLLALYVDPSISMTAGGERGIRADILSRFVRRYYEDAEGTEAPYDAELASLLSQIEREQMVPLLPLSQFERVPTAGLSESVPMADGARDTLGQRALVHWERGEHERAMELLVEQERICREQDDPGGVAVSLTDQGLVMRDRGDESGARVKLREALEIAQAAELLGFVQRIESRLRQDVEYPHGLQASLNRDRTLDPQERLEAMRQEGQARARRIRDEQETGLDETPRGY